MSDNVSKFDPHPGKSIARRIVLFVLALVLVGGAVTLYVFRDSLNLDAAKRFVRYLNVKTDSAPAVASRLIPITRTSTRTCRAALPWRLSPGSVFMTRTETSLPSCRRNWIPRYPDGRQAHAGLRRGRNEPSCCAAVGETALSLTTQRPIFDADMAADGSLCYATSESGYKTVLYVYDSNQNRIYRWLSASQFMPVCAVSAGGKYLASVSLGQRDGIYASSLHIFQTAKEDSGIMAALGGDLIYDLTFLDASTICAVGESGAKWLDVSGSLLADYTYNDAYLKDFDFGGDGFLSLIVNMYKAGNHCSVVTVDKTGTELGSAELDVQILDFSAAGEYLAVLTAEKLTIYTSAMKPYFEQANTTSATNVIMRADGSAVLLGGGRGEIILP